MNAVKMATVKAYDTLTHRKHQLSNQVKYYTDKLTKSTKE